MSPSFGRWEGAHCYSEAQQQQDQCLLLLGRQQSIVTPVGMERRVPGLATGPPWKQAQLAQEHTVEHEALRPSLPGPHKASVLFVLFLRPSRLPASPAMWHSREEAKKKKTDVFGSLHVVLNHLVKPSVTFFNAQCHRKQELCSLYKCSPFFSRW